MTRTVDANILVYAVNRADPRHDAAVAAIERLSSESERVLLLWPAVMAYLRVVTFPRLLPRPLSLDQATQTVTALLERPNIRLASDTADGWPTFLEIAEAASIKGNLVHDAHLVALMRQHGVETIWTNDTDFHRFPGIRVVNPLR